MVDCVVYFHDDGFKFAFRFVPLLFVFRRQHLVQKLCNTNIGLLFTIFYIEHSLTYISIEDIYIYNRYTCIY